MTDYSSTGAPGPESSLSGWWSKHRLLAVATVALAGVAVLVAGVLILVVSIFKGSDAYRDAIAQARANPIVVHELGGPIHAGWWVTGSITVNGPSGQADFSTSIQGPTSSGTLYVTAEKRAGQWQYKVLEVAIPGKVERIDLLIGHQGV